MLTRRVLVQYLERSAIKTDKARKKIKLVKILHPSENVIQSTVYPLYSMRLDMFLRSPVGPAEMPETLACD
jgi:hypothetical protein